MTLLGGLTRHGGYFDLDASQEEVKTLQEKTSDPDFWKNQDKAKSINKRLAELEKELTTWKELRILIQDQLDLLKLAQEEGDESLHDESAKKIEELTKKFENLEFYILFDGKYDKNNAIVSMHAGSGGTEAQDWVEMLLRMIVRFAESKDWEVQTLDMKKGQEAGIKSVTLRIEGRYAYGFLQSESGVHRLVRISPFDAEKMRHTSFALVEVLPELPEAEEITIDPKDLRIDTFMASGKGGQSVNTTYSAVRIVHEPTKISVSVQNERSQKQNKETAMKILQSKLHQLELDKKADEKQELRGDYKSAEWSNQIRSYVLHPYKLVKDHRTNHDSSAPDEVLDGDLQAFMEAYLRLKRGKKAQK